MIFEQQLFEQVQKLLPNTTTRSFSCDCGMSENYYCSVRSQGLSMSTSALVHLAEVLEHRAALNQTTKPIDAVLKLIADEIAERMQTTKSASHFVQVIIAKAVATLASERTGTYQAPPIVIGW